MSTAKNNNDCASYLVTAKAQLLDDIINSFWTRYKKLYKVYYSQLSNEIYYNTDGEKFIQLSNCRAKVHQKLQYLLDEIMNLNAKRDMLIRD